MATKLDRQVDQAIVRQVNQKTAKLLADHGFDRLSTSVWQCDVVCVYSQGSGLYMVVESNEVVVPNLTFNDLQDYVALGKRIFN